MADIKINISTQAELAAAKAMEQQLERSIGKARLLGKNYDDLAANLGKVRERLSQLAQAEQAAAQPADQIGNSIKDLGEKSEEAAKGKGKLLDGLKRLGQEVPAVGAILNTIKNPLTAIGFVAAFAIAHFDPREDIWRHYPAGRAIAFERHLTPEAKASRLLLNEVFHAEAERISARMNPHA